MKIRKPGSSRGRLTWIVLAVLGSGMAQAEEYSAWSQAVNLGPVVNTTANEGCPFIARSGLTLYVVSTRADGYGGQDIYVSQRDTALDPWGPPQNLGARVNSASNDLCPTLAIDGRRLFFVSDRPGGQGKQDLYLARRQDSGNDFGWRRPVNLGPAVNSTENDFTPTLFNDRRQTVLYFGSDRPGGMGGVDIYSSTAGADGVFEWAELVVELSTELIDERPNVRPDGLEIYFDSNRPGSLGSTDLWLSTRDSTDAPWSLPVNLGADINTASGEMRPSLSYDGRTLYFNSNRPEGHGSSDIYVAKRAKAHDPKCAL